MSKRILMIAAYTIRSQAYLQALRNALISIDGVITFGPDKGGLPGQGSVKQAGQIIKEVFLPNLSIHLLDSIKEHKCYYIHVDVNSVNDEKIFHALKYMDPGLIIYSGYGGEIVSKELLNVGCPVIHMHSGLLPHYRGSTTMYYSWIKERKLGVTAIIMAEGIDQGDIILRKQFDVPVKGINPDYIYDSAIRASTLVDVIQYFKVNNCLPEAVSQKKEDGMDYYVIHPLLKHIALLSQDGVLKDA